jgi:hypothetical protein
MPICADCGEDHEPLSPEQEAEKKKAERFLQRMKEVHEAHGPLMEKLAELIKTAPADDQAYLAVSLFHLQVLDNDISNDDMLSMAEYAQYFGPEREIVSALQQMSAAPSAKA